MNTTKTTATMTDATNLLVRFVPEAVRVVYSGRPGCMCGCRGIFRYSSKHATSENTDEVNDTQVKRVLARIAAAPVEALEFGLDIDDCPYVTVDVGERRYAAYLAA